MNPMTAGERRRKALLTLAGVALRGGVTTPFTASAACDEVLAFAVADGQITQADADAMREIIREEIAQTYAAMQAG